jgi:acetylornithine/N-succinyldiaminopimelate aminotransferase
LRELCDREDILLIFDEVQCGLGRTGKLFAYENYGVEPDIMTLAKPLGGGLPLGAALAGDKVCDVLTPGSHASTFGGNPVACAAGFAMLEFMLSDGLVWRAGALGERLISGFSGLKGNYSFITDVRGAGLMAGLELSFPGKKIVEECFNRGLLVNCTSENFIRFLPPLTVSEKQIDYALGILEDVFRDVNTQGL